MAPRLIDTTLREGSQAPVRYLPAQRQRELIAGLARIGVEEIELGHAVTERAYGVEPLTDLIRIAAEVAPGTRRAIWCRARPDDIEAAAALRPDVVSFALPVSDLHLSQRLRRSADWAVDQLQSLVRLARSAGVASVSVGLEDASRADPRFLTRVLRAADRAGADRVRLADTVGIAAPGDVIDLVGLARSEFGGEIAVHLHDDFGMATANAVAALESGADWADVSLLGLGERAGISRTEEITAWLVTRRGAGYDVLAARGLARQLASDVERPVPPHAPVIGSQIFTCESGLHLAGLLRDPATYEPYPPELVGMTRSLRIGRGAGRTAVAGLVPESAEDATAAAARLRRAAAERTRSLDAEEIATISRLPEIGRPRHDAVDQSTAS